MYVLSVSLLSSLKKSEALTLPLMLQTLGNRLSKARYFLDNLESGKFMQHLHHPHLVITPSVSQQKSFKSRNFHGNYRQKLEDLTEDFKSESELIRFAEDDGELSSLRGFQASLLEMDRRAEALQYELALHCVESPSACIVEIRSGAGGRDSMDFVEILFKMYSSWAGLSGHSLVTVGSTPGADEGYKSISFRMEGKGVYRIMKHEVGTHRLIRISTFGRNLKRQTSFASLNVFTSEDEAEDAHLKGSGEMNFSSSDLKVEYMRASGPGGQSVNKSETAVRITHLPSGLSTHCQKLSSQLENHRLAMKFLEAELMKRKLKEAKAQHLIEKVISRESSTFGYQIRTYCRHSTHYVKDHRTKIEDSYVDEILSGARFEEFMRKNIVNLYF